MLILADDMGFGDLGFFGNPDVQPPTLDEMAKDSVCLTQHYSAAPICAPSRASLLTGLYYQRTGHSMCKEWRGISPKVRTAAHYFRESGYATRLDVDPFERNDIARHYPERVRRMSGEIDRWFESCMADYEQAIKW